MTKVTGEAPADLFRKFLVWSFRKFAYSSLIGGMKVESMDTVVFLVSPSPNVNWRIFSFVTVFTSIRISACSCRKIIHKRLGHWQSIHSIKKTISKTVKASAGPTTTAFLAKCVSGRLSLSLLISGNCFWSLVCGAFVCWTRSCVCTSLDRLDSYFIISCKKYRLFTTVGADSLYS